MKSEANQDRTRIWPYGLALLVVVAALYVVQDPPVPAETPEQVMARCNKPAASPFKEDYSCIHARANMFAPSKGAPP